MYVDENGNKVFDDKYLYAMDFSEGMGLVQNYDYKFSFINMQGKVIIDDLYNAESFKNGFAVVTEMPEDVSYDSLTTDRELRCYFIDKAGNKVFNKTFIRADSFSEGVACVQVEGTYVPSNERNLYTYIDTSGEYATELLFDYAESFENGKAIVEINGVRGYIDRNFEFHEYQIGDTK